MCFCVWHSFITHKSNPLKYNVLRVTATQQHSVTHQQFTINTKHNNHMLYQTVYNMSRIEISSSGVMGDLLTIVTDLLSVVWGLPSMVTDIKQLIVTDI